MKHFARHLGALLLVFATMLAAFPAAKAGDIAERQILGFSPDGRYFAFEQFGVQDGSGFPYADIFVIDTATDKWDSGSPYRVMMRDDRAEIKWARREAMTKAGNRLRELVISNPGRLLASNPPPEISTDPHSITVNAHPAIPQAEEPWTLRMQEIAIARADCTPLLGGPAKGFRLSLTGPDGVTRVLQDDKKVPESRGCPMRYALSDVVLFDGEGARRVFAILISVYSFGFEGADRRFVAITHQVP
jgi:predicted secreted protein